MSRSNTKVKAIEWTNLRVEHCKEVFGLYWKINCSEFDLRHQFYCYATKIEITPHGDLLLYKDSEVYRAFSVGQWNTVATVSCIDGLEMWEFRLR